MGDVTPDRCPNCEGWQEAHDIKVAEVEQLRVMLRKGADLMQHGPTWDDERADWAREVEALDG